MSNTDGVRIGIFGKPGSGKSYFFHHKVIPVLDDQPVFIFDAKGEYQKVKGSVYFVGVREFFQFIANRKKIRNKIYVIRVTDPADLDIGLQFVNSLQLRSTVVIEELKMSIANAGKREKSIKRSIMHIARMGRSYGQSLILISQRPYDLDTDYRAVLSTVIAFHLTLKNDIDVLEKDSFIFSKNPVDFVTGQYEILGEHNFITKKIK